MLRRVLWSLRDRLAGLLLLIAAVAGPASSQTALAGLDLRADSLLTVNGFPYPGSSFSVAGVGDVNGDGRPDLAVGVGSTPRGRQADAGAVWVPFTPAGRGRIDIRKRPFPGLLIRGASTSYDPYAHDDPDNDFAGAQVVPLGDVNGDGLADFAIAAPFARYLGRQYAGAVYVVFGRRAAGTIDLRHLGSGGYLVVGPRAGSTLGVSLAAAGDVNGDGIADLIAGTPAYQSFFTKTHAGGAWIIYGRRTPGAVDLAQPGNGYQIIGGANSISAGLAVSGLGDVNGDGIPDAAISQPFETNDTKDSNGSVFVVYGRRDGQPVQLGHLGAGGFRTTGTAGEAFGSSLAGPGDVNGDGIPDLLIGAPGIAGSTAAGRVYVVFGAPRSGTLPLARLAHGAIVIRGEPQDRAGAALAAIGDVNHDGLADFVIGAPFASHDCRPAAGAVYLVHGQRAAGTISLTKPGAAGIIDGVQPVDEAGQAVAAAGDLTNHGADLLIASPAGDADIPIIHGHAVTDWNVNAVAAEQVRSSTSRRGRACISLHVLPTTRTTLLRTGRLRVRVTTLTRYRLATELVLYPPRSQRALATLITPGQSRPDTAPATSTVTVEIPRDDRARLTQPHTTQLDLVATQIADAGGGCCPTLPAVHATIRLR